MPRDRTVKIEVMWPARADRDVWRFYEARAIDKNGVSHVLDIVGVTPKTTETKPKKRKAA